MKLPILIVHRKAQARPPREQEPTEMESHPRIRAVVRATKEVVVAAQGLAGPEELLEDTLAMAAKELEAIYMLQKRAVRPMPKDPSTPPTTEVEEINGRTQLEVKEA